MQSIYTGNGHDEPECWTSITIAWMRISMNEAGVEDLLGKNLKQFTINIGNVEFILFNSLHITNFIAIDPLGR